MDTPRWFWLIVFAAAMAFWAVAAAVLRRAERAGRVDPRDASALMRGGVLLSGAFTLMAAGIQLSSGWSYPLCFLERREGDPTAIAFAALVACTAVSAAVWLRRGGAEGVARVFAGFQRFPPTQARMARMVRGAGTVLAAAAVMVALLVWMPSFTLFESPRCGAGAEVVLRADSAWRVVYDVADHPAGPPLFGILLLLVPCIIWAVTDASQLSPWDRVLIWSVTIASVVLGPSAAVHSYRKDAAFRAARLTGRYNLLNGGEVTWYQPASDRAGMDQFSVGVDTHVFQVGPGVRGYDRNAATGSVIREHATVRIYEVDGQIARLEILR